MYVREVLTGKRKHNGFNDEEMEIIDSDPELIRLYFLDRARFMRDKARIEREIALDIGGGLYDEPTPDVSLVWAHLEQAERAELTATAIEENIDAFVESSHNSYLSSKNELTKSTHSDRKVLEIWKDMRQ